MSAEFGRLGLPCSQIKVLEFEDVAITFASSNLVIVCSLESIDSRGAFDPDRNSCAPNNAYIRAVIFAQIIFLPQAPVGCASKVLVPVLQCF